MILACLDGFPFEYVQSPFETGRGPLEMNTFGSIFFMHGHKQWTVKLVWLDPKICQ